MAEAALATRPAAQAMEPLLAVRGLEAWYGESHVLHGIELDVAEGDYATVSKDPRVIEAYIGVGHG